MTGRLVAILHSEPLGSGTRTINRVRLAQQVLGQKAFTIVNVFPGALRGTNELNTVPVASVAWQESRAQILEALERQDVSDVLLGYGVNLPTGSHRLGYRRQLEWLGDELQQRSLRVWGFGGRPTHPSRWQREVFRQYPGATLDAVAADLLLPITPPRAT